MRNSVQSILLMAIFQVALVEKNTPKDNEV